jgi:sugar lactone lactonase YvrE
VKLDHRPLVPLICLLLGLALAGCAEVWTTAVPSPAPGGAEAGRDGAPVQSAPLLQGPTREGILQADAPTPTPMPLAPLVVKDVPLQWWTDPNDITGLLLQGEFLWAVAGGVVRWRVDTGEARVFGLGEGLASHAVRGIAQDAQGHIWVGYSDHGGWSVYDGERWRTYASREEAVKAHYAALKEMPGEPRLWSARPGSAWVWLPTADGRVAAYDGESWHYYGEEEGVRPGVWLVALSAQGRVWAVGEGLSTTMEGQRRWEGYPFFLDIAEGGRITSLAVDAQGMAWVTFIGPPGAPGGLARFDPEAKRWSRYSQDLNPALPAQVYGLALGTEGTLWLCGQGGLAWQRLGEPWRALPWKGLTVQCFLQDGMRRFWLGTDRGLQLAEPQAQEPRGPWALPASLWGNEIRALALDGRGTLWIGTPRGLVHAQPSGETSLALAVGVEHLVLGPQGQLWAATEDGLYRMRPDGPPERLDPRKFVALAGDTSGALWACTAEGELGRWAGDVWQPLVNMLELAKALPTDLALDAGGTLWLALPRGVGRLTPQGELTLETTKDGLPVSEVRALALATDGTLWAATPRGLVRRQPSGQWILLTVTSTEGGLRSMDVRDLVLDAEGTLWVATAAGISARTVEADWSYYDLPGARCLLPEATGGVWVGTQGGLYRLQRGALTPVP